MNIDSGRFLRFQVGNVNGGIRSAVFKALVAAVVVFGLLLAADQMSIAYGLDGSQRIVDDVLGGMLAGGILYIHERHRARVLREKLITIDLLNHHIRNALQPLMFMHHQCDQDTQMRIIDDCVSRIDFALREVLPGKSTELFVAPDDPVSRHSA